MQVSGICALSIDSIFSLVESIKQHKDSMSDYKTHVKLSYLEVYNENIKDLLSNNRDTQQLMIIEDPNKGIHVPGLKEIEVHSCSEAMKIILLGNEK